MNSRSCPKRLFLALNLIAVAAILLPAWSGAGATTFSVTQISDVTEDAANAAIAVDARGVAHMVFEAGGNVYYTTSLGSSTTRINRGTSAQRPSIALDSAGNAVVAYFDDQGNVWEASNATGAWQRSETGFVTLERWGSVSVLVDADDTPHVVWPTLDYDIFHGYRPGASWQSEAATANEIGELNSSFALDASSNVHVVFERSRSNIGYATNAGGTWEEAALTDDLGVGQELPSIAVDGGGRLHVVYALDDTGLVYATNPGSGWQYEVMGTAEGSAKAAVVVDHLGTVHAVYQDFIGGGVVYYTNNQGGEWTAGEAVDEKHGRQSLTWVERPVALDDLGYLHVVFVGDAGSFEPQQVYYATSDAPVASGNPGGTCAVPLPLACGATVTGDNSGHASNIDFYGCSSSEESAPDVVYSFDLPQGAVYDVTAEVSTSNELDLRVYLLEAAGCSSGTCLPGTAIANSSAFTEAVPPGTYHLAVDGSQSQGGEYSLKLDCVPVEQRCTPDDTTLCLNDSRFRVTARYRSQGEEEKVAEAVAMTSDTGYFWFFDRDNVEIVAKVLGCVNGSYWVFAAGLTNVEVTLRVEDAQTEQYREYVNPLGQAFQPLQDTSAFEGCE